MADFKFYEKDGMKYERVSTVLDFFTLPRLVEWKVRVGKAESGKASRTALKIGSRVDELVYEDYVRGGYKLIKADCYEVRSAMQGWEKFKAEHKPNIVAMQETVYHDDWMVAGTLDIRTDRAVLDIKTSREISLKYWLQTAVYNRNLALPYLGIVDLSKNLGDYVYEEKPYTHYYCDVFVGMLSAFLYFKQDEDGF